ncbi:beta-galactosidase [Flammeovirgaceae bacterium 311]|nr:beta-galactosidase [Flammeovirgaceae bacterium 311]
MQEYSRKDFGSAFVWGTAISAYQTEGAAAADGKGPSIWDHFCTRKGKIAGGDTGNTASNFYQLWQQDVALLQSLNIPNFRFSISWPRVLPQGSGTVNQKGLDFYDRLIDRLLEAGINPWVTLYHWDLPQALEEKGGWTNRQVVDWFSDFTSLCARRFGDRVNHWMVLNEPLAFTGAGHFLGIHAPGRRWLKNFLPAVHHAALCQAAGGRILRQLCPQAQIGSTFSGSWVEPLRPWYPKDVAAAQRTDALLNRLFLEPALGLGYPLQALPFLQRLDKYLLPGDEQLLPFDFDFIGLQLYTREIVRYSFWVPLLQARLVSAAKRAVPGTEMNWEVHPPALYHMLMQYSRYKGIKKIIITENGAAFADKLVNGRVQDTRRQQYLQEHLDQLLKARQAGAPVAGYFVWSFLDNFEWAEGYRPRFGLVYVDYATQKRTVKDSGLWYSRFLAEGASSATESKQPHTF